MIVKLNIKKGPAGYVKRPSQLLYLDYAYFERDFYYLQYIMTNIKDVRMLVALELDDPKIMFNACLASTNKRNGQFKRWMIDPQFNPW